MLFEASKRCSAFTGFCCLGFRGSKELSYLTVCVGLNWAGRIDEWHAIKAETLYEIMMWESDFANMNPDSYVDQLVLRTRITLVDDDG